MVKNATNVDASTVPVFSHPEPTAGFRVLFFLRDTANTLVGEKKTKDHVGRQDVAVHCPRVVGLLGGGEGGVRQNNQERCEELSTEVVVFRSTEPKNSHLPTQYTAFVSTTIVHELLHSMWSR